MTHWFGSWGLVSRVAVLSWRCPLQKMMGKMPVRTGLLVSARALCGKL
jgi:hypothetical protein